MKNSVYLFILCVFMMSCQSDTTLFINLKETQGLQIGNALEVNGLKIGTIEAIELADNFNAVVVATTLNENINIPVGSEFKIRSIDILGTKAIDVTYSDSKDFYLDGDTIEGQIQDFHFESIYLKALEGLAPSLFQADTTEIDHSCEIP